MPISKIITGGQTGVDRAALDAAIALSTCHGGWCPKGGLAENYSTQPGLLAAYPLLCETPSYAPSQRTDWNVRDSDAVLILLDRRGIGCPAGTIYTQEQAQHYCRPAMFLNIGDYASLDKAATWLGDLASELALNVAGPRESEAPGIYNAGKYFLEDLLQQAKGAG